MDNMELRERLEELRKVINGAYTFVLSGNTFQSATWSSKSLQLITEILQDYPKE